MQNLIESWPSYIIAVLVSEKQECIKDTSLCGQFRHKRDREHEGFCLSSSKKWPRQDCPFNSLSSHGGFTQLPRM